jgi:hypothetical protein
LWSQWLISRLRPWNLKFGSLVYIAHHKHGSSNLANGCCDNIKSQDSPLQTARYSLQRKVIQGHSITSHYYNSPALYPLLALSIGRTADFGLWISIAQWPDASRRA